MLLIQHIEPYSVFKLDPAGPVPSIPSQSDQSGSSLWTIARTHDELSLVCATSFVPEMGVFTREDDWCAFRVAGTMDFSLTGIIAQISDPIARAGIGIFVVSTFDTDYILIKENNVRASIEAWRRHGIDVVKPLIHTTRLLLVNLAPEFADLINGNRDNKVWVSDYPTDGDVLIARLQQEVTDLPRDDLPSIFQVRLRSTGEAIGGIGFKAHHCEGNLDGVEIGYSIANSQQGRGFATEAIAGVIQLAQQRGFRNLLAETDVGNIASQKALQANGFNEFQQSEQGIWWRISL